MTKVDDTQIERSVTWLIELSRKTHFDFIGDDLHLAARALRQEHRTVVHQANQLAALRAEMELRERALIVGLLLQDDITISRAAELTEKPITEIRAWVKDAFGVPAQANAEVLAASLYGVELDG